MNLFTQLFRRAAFVLAFVLTLGAATAARAADDNLGAPAGSVSVPSGLNKDDVKKAVILTLAGRNWSLKDKTDDKVVGYLKHRANEATVTFVYSETSVELYCIGYEIDKKTGERKRPEQPAGWLKFLRGDLTKHLTQAAATK